METILSYLDNMFMNFPDTEKVTKIREELALMMEDKYNELLAEGKKQNEAIGIVISEFGDLKELQEELGEEQHERSAGALAAEKAVDRKRDMGSQKAKIRRLTRENVENYREIAMQGAKGISIGVMLCICSPTFLLVLAMLDEGRKHAISDAIYVVGGVVPLFLMVGIAVALFINYGSKMEQYEYLKKEPFEVMGGYLIELEKIKESEKKCGMTKITAGVLICIFSVIPLLISACINEAFVLGSVIVLLLLISVAVRLFIVGETQIECMKVLFQEEEFTAAAKKSNKLIDAIASIYWSVVVAAYLIWSFVTNGWGYTWIIWPVAGMIFGALAVIVGIVEKYLEARKSV